MRTLSDHKLFENWGREPEYVDLLKTSFAQLPQATQEEILGWIEQGPDLSHVREDVGDDERKQHIMRWQSRRLKVLKGALAQSWEERFAAVEVAQAQSEEEDAEGGWVGPTSPLTTAEVARLAPSELVAFLKTWNPPSGWREPTPEGLARAISEVVAGNPDAFASNAELFIGLPPTYVRALLGGLRDALKASRPFSWDRVLAVCEWAVRQEPQDEHPVGDAGSDRGWSWCRGAAANLVSLGVDTASIGIPFTDRAQVWRIIEPVTSDPDPGPERDSEDGDPMQVAINSVRGDGLSAAVRYAVWVESNLRGEAEQPVGLEAMPEFRAVLQAHLDPNIDPSLAIRALFGEWFPVLHWIDPVWATNNWHLVFPDGDGQQNLKRAAWETFIRFHRPVGTLFSILGPLYREAVSAPKVAVSVAAL